MEANAGAASDANSWLASAAAARRACELASALVVVAACCLVHPGQAHAAADADDANADDVDAVTTADRPTASAAPRVTRTGDELPARIDVPGLAMPMAGRAEWSGASYRWWMSHGRADVGMGLGTLSYVARPASDGASPAALATGSAPVVTVGMRYRTTDTSAVFADASNARGLGSNRGDLYFGKVGVEWKPNPKPWSMVQGGVGLQLDSDAHMTVRLRHGVLGLFMKSQF